MLISNVQTAYGPYNLNLVFGLILTMASSGHGQRYLIQEWKVFTIFFQSYACVNTVLGTTILSMLEPRASQSANELSLHEKFRGALRCMMSSDLKYVYRVPNSIFGFLAHLSQRLKVRYCFRCQQSSIMHHPLYINFFLKTTSPLKPLVQI